MVPQTTDNQSGWHQLWDGPFRAGVDRIYKGADGFNETRERKDKRKKAKAVANVALGIVELVPLVNIPVAAADRCWIQGKYLIGHEPFIIHILYHSMTCFGSCLDASMTYCADKPNNKPKSD